MKRHIETSKNATPPHVVPEFRAWLAEVGKPSGKTPEQVWVLWRNYAKTCEDFDQSPVEFEFLEWYKADLAGPAVQPCDYCGTPTEDNSSFPVCEECAGKIKRHEYGTCQGDGYPLDPRGMCCAPLSAAD